MGSDDNISVKLAGTHDSGWLDHGISFSGKKVCLGVEKNHPHTDACEVEGPGNIGDLKGKKIGIAGVWFASGNTEIWYDVGGGWKKGASGSKIGGFSPSGGNHETQLRIDDAPKLTIHCSNVQEIGPGGGGAACTYWPLEHVHIPQGLILLMLRSILIAVVCIIIITNHVRHNRYRSHWDNYRWNILCITKWYFE